MPVVIVSIILQALLIVHCIKTGRPVEGLTALDVNVDVVEIIEAAKKSIKTGQAVPLAKRGN